MCDPVTIGATMAATSAASSLLGFAGQSAAASANTRAANLGYAQNMNQLGEREAQIDQQQSENTVQATIDRITAQGRISASAAAGGSDEATAARGENAAAFSAGRGLGIEDINSNNQRLGVANDQTAAFYRRQSQENQVLAPSPLGLALNLAKAGLQGASAFAGVGGQLGGTTGDSAPSTAVQGGAADGDGAVDLSGNYSPVGSGS